eukprot:evm.model.scf_4497.1 EVM.evm.TU.scf_4497.1   scf_4497:5954-6487(-)
MQLGISVVVSMDDRPTWNPSYNPDAGATWPPRALFHRTIDPARIQLWASMAGLEYALGRWLCERGGDTHSASLPGYGFERGELYFEIRVDLPYDDHEYWPMFFGRTWKQYLTLPEVCRRQDFVRQYREIGTNTRDSEADMEINRNLIVHRAQAERILRVRRGEPMETNAEIWMRLGF